MTSDGKSDWDAYIQSVRDQIDAVMNWLPTITPFADIEHKHEKYGWWVKVAPHNQEACRFTLGLHADGQYDLFAGALFHQEDWTWPEGYAAINVCAAIAAGRIIETEWRSKWWNLPARSISVIDASPDGDWEDEYRLLLPLPLAWCNRSTRFYTPFDDSFQ